MEAFINNLDEKLETFVGQNGIKISGGIRTLQDLQNHLDSMENATQVTSLGPKRFRIGASSLLNSIEKILEK